MIFTQWNDNSCFVNWALVTSGCWWMCLRRVCGVGCWIRSFYWWNGKVDVAILRKKVHCRWNLFIYWNNIGRYWWTTHEIPTISNMYTTGPRFSVDCSPLTLWKGRRKSWDVITPSWRNTLKQPIYSLVFSVPIGPNATIINKAVNTLMRLQR